MASEHDIDTLARTCYGEARGEGDQGMHAVANVVANRAALAHQHPHFGDGSFAGACLAHMEFDCWMMGDPNLQKIRATTQDDPSFASAMQIAQSAADGSLEDITNGATYYYASGTTQPAWAEGQTPCAEIGRHLFFSNIA